MADAAARRCNEKQILLNFKQYLISHIEPFHCEVIAHCVKMDGVIEESEFEEIMRLEENKKVETLIRFVLSHSKQGFFRSFLNAIPEGLSHVKEFLEGSSNPMSQSAADLKHRMKLYRSKIVPKIKVKDIVFHFPEILDDATKQEVLSKKTDIRKAFYFLNYVEKREKSIELLLEALKSEICGCGQIAKLLEEDEKAENKKGDKKILYIKNSYDFLNLVEGLEPNDFIDFLDIADEQRNLIKELPTREERVDYLLLVLDGKTEWQKQLLAALKHKNCPNNYTSVIDSLENSDFDEVEIEEREEVCEDEPNPHPNMEGTNENLELNIVSPPSDANELNKLSNEESENAETAEMDDLQFQIELASPAIEGNNCVIVSETGTGKTYVAVRICQDHIIKNGNAKVIFLVHKVPLVKQQYKVFKKNLKMDDVTIECLSGDMLDKTPVADLLRETKVVIMTHDILKNVLRSKKFQMKEISLLFFDECHNAMKNHPYRAIMEIYFEEKQKESQLPQVVGLTATPGSGKACGTDEACRHIKTLLANLDVVIPPVMVTENTAELAEYISDGSFETVQVKRNPKDKFAPMLIKLMNQIESQIKDKLQKNDNCTNGLQFNITAAHGTQAYEGSIIQFGSQVALKIKESTLGMDLTLYAGHLRMYNDALLVHDHLRPSNAIDFIDGEINKDCSENLTIQFLKELYNKSEIHHGSVTTSGSPLLLELIKLLQLHFTSKPDSRCIVFVRTRAIAMHLANCLNQDQQLCGFNLNASYLTGSGVSRREGGLTKNEQDNCLDMFRKGGSKVIAATTIADEGIDIKACNLVVTYNHATNEITEVQRQGRGRARDSQMVVLCYDDSKFIIDHNLNKARQQLVKESLEIFKTTDRDAFLKDVRRIQKEESSKLASVTRQHVGGVWKFLCKTCREYVTTSEKFCTIKNAHHVVIDELFQEKYEVVLYDKIQTFDFLQAIGEVRCKNPQCRRPWGREIIYRESKHQILSVKNFILENGEKTSLPKKWCLAPFKVERSYNDYSCDQDTDEN